MSLSPHRLLIAGLLLAAGAGCSSSIERDASDTTTVAVPVNASTTTSIPAEQLCFDNVSIDILGFSTAVSFDQAVTDLAMKYGTSSAQFQEVLDVYAQYSADAIQNSQTVAAGRLGDRIREACHRLTDTDAAPEVAPTIAVHTPTEFTPTVPTEQEHPDADEHAAWWTLGVQEAPAFLAEAVHEWTDGTVPSEYAACSFAGTISEPEDWNEAGPVTLAPASSGGWILQWPGTFDKYVRIMLPADVSADRELSSVAAVRGSSNAGFESWQGDAYALLRATSPDCWYQWGVSVDAPQGEQRAFYSGMRFLTSSGARPVVPPPTEPTAEATVTCGVGGVDVLRRASSGAAPCPSVQQFQDVLVFLGYSPDTDGIFGPATEAAVSAFQSSYGLEVDGLVGPQTWAAATTAQIGD